MQYTIRQAVANDLDSLDRIHAENMKGYVEKVYSWQPFLFRHSYTPQDYQVIEVGRETVGFIILPKEDPHFSLHDTATHIVMG